MRISSKTLLLLLAITFLPFSNLATAQPGNAVAHGMWGPGRFGHGGPMMAMAMRFLNDASFRDSVEAPMTSEEKQTIDADVAQIKSDMASLKALRPQMKAARQAHDTAAFEQLMSTARPLFQQMGADRKAIMTIVVQYHPKAAALSRPAMRARFAVEMRFLRDANFRDSIDAKMSTLDKDSIETCITQIKSDFSALRNLRPEMKAARQSTDTQQIRSPRASGKTAFQQIRADRRTILEILARYRGVTSAAATNLLDPVYPNPVRLGSGGATITYHLTSASPVEIVVTDASGNTVATISKGVQPAGNYTLSIGSSIARPGAYYVTVIAGGQKGTQKVAVLQ